VSRTCEWASGSRFAHREPDAGMLGLQPMDAPLAQPTGPHIQ
jgi:hypothetical protein